MKNIQSFISEYEDMQVQVSPDVSYSLRDVINESYRLYNSKFQNETDSTGFQKIFYNIIWIVYRTIIMASDIDLKDMQMHSLNGQKLPIVNILKMALRSFLNKVNFGKTIDNIMNQMVWFGTSLVKRCKGKLEQVDLRNYITEPHIKDPQMRSHAENVFYTYDQMAYYKDDFKEHWAEIEETWEVMQKGKENLFKVIEYWTWDEIDGKTHKVCIKYLDRSELDPKNFKDAEEWDTYLELDKFITPYKKKRDSKEMRDKLGEHEEMFPYEQADFFDCPGRWMGMGCAEILAGIQEHYNEQYNLKRKKDILDLKGIFVHKYTTTSNSLTQEFLDNIETGDVLSMDMTEDLQRLIIDTKTGEFTQTVDKLYEIARLLMGIQATSAGEDLPSQTATAAVINKQAQQTTYDFVREQMHHFLVKIFQDGYFEDISNEFTSQDIINVVGDPKELQALDQILIDNAVNAEFERIKNETGMYPPAELYDQMKQQLAQQLQQMGDTRYPQIKKELMKNLEFFVEFFVTNEKFDKNIKIQNLIMMKQDPNFTGSREAVDAEIASLNDLNPAQFAKTDEERRREIEMMRQKAMAENVSPEVPQPMEDNMGIRGVSPLNK